MVLDKHLFLKVGSSNIKAMYIMKDEDKTKEQFINELVVLHQRIFQKIV